MFAGAVVGRLRKHAANGQSPTGCKQREVVVCLLKRRTAAAALRYQHVAQDADQALAERLSKLARSGESST
jgi:hypothetical protein